MTRPIGFTLIAAAVILLAIAVVALWLASEAAADLPALRDEIDRYRSEVVKLTETVHQTNRRLDSLGVAEPATRPQPIVRAVPTEPVEAVVERGIAELADAVARHGKHAYRGVDA